MEQLHGKEHSHPLWIFTRNLFRERDVFHGTCSMCNSREFGWHYDSIVSFVFEDSSTKGKNYMNVTNTPVNTFIINMASWQLLSIENFVFFIEENYCSFENPKDHMAWLTDWRDWRLLFCFSQFTEITTWENCLEFCEKWKLKSVHQ